MFSFLEYRDWENACKLLAFQISRKAENRHFNTLSIHAYENQSIDALKSEAYFSNHIKNGCVLFREDILYSRHFPSPKGTFRYRHWSFLSLQMRLLYYALGLHIARKLTDIPSADKVASRYGANIQQFCENGQIKLEASYVYYKKNYQDFYKEALSRVEALESDQDAVELGVVRMDLENFFEQIDLTTLLTLPYVQPAEFPLPPIRLFFSLMTWAPKGLPQTCNDPVAGYLSWLYLKQFDLALAQFLKEQSAINDFSVYRYCDDAHVFLHFPKDTAEALMQEQVATLIEFCKGFLWKEYKLRFNSKTVYYHLNDKDERQKYKDSLKSTSMGEDCHIDEDRETYDFYKTYRSFIDNIGHYLQCDLMKGDVSSLVKENMKKIYDRRFQADLGRILAQDSVKRTSVEQRITDEISDCIARLDRAHLVYEPRVFAFFKKYYPDKFKSLLLEESPDTETPSVSYQWALCGFGLDDLYEQQGEANGDIPYLDRLKQLDLYAIQQPETANAETIEKIAKFLQAKIESRPAESFEYLSYFTCQRRAAELSGDFNATLNYLNSECCILLGLLGWNLGPKSRPKNYIFHHSVVEYKDVKKETTLALWELAQKRNDTDLSHNKTKVPDGLSQSVSQEDYENLKTRVFQEIVTRQKELTQTQEVSTSIASLTFAPLEASNAHPPKEKHPSP